MTSNGRSLTNRSDDNADNAIGAQVTWVWDASQQLYYSRQSSTYAYTDPQTGQWHYLPASSVAGTSSTGPTPAGYGGEGKEEGEIEDDVGWGGLMEPEDLEKALKTKGKSSHTGDLTQSATRYGTAEKHPAYGVSSRGRTPSPPPKETPKHLLRLVVLSSPSLTPGHVAIIDAREGGVQIGRDRCEKGGHPRIRVKEMEVSKTHAVVYWGQGGEDEDEGWWTVDLGSTHGTFVSDNTASKASPSDGGGPTTADADIDGDPLHAGQRLRDSESTSERHRLSEPKVSSLPYQLHHMAILSLGQTRFEVHAHESWPCEKCQLGRGNEIPIDTGEASIVNNGTAQSHVQGQAQAYAMNSQERRDNREVKRKREMAALKDTLLNRSTVAMPREGTHDGQNRYVDRSALRRQMHPRSPPPTGRVDIPETSSGSQKNPEPAAPGPVSAFAQNMLASQGWAPGSGLGKGQTGRSEAIEVKMRVEKRGLGAQGAERPAGPAGGEDVGDDWRRKGKARRFDEMRGW